jgi:hypothetical protein
VQALSPIKKLCVLGKLRERLKKERAYAHKTAQAQKYLIFQICVSAIRLPL